MKCLHCEITLLPAPTRKSIGAKKFCNASCQGKFQTSEKIKAFIRGEYTGQLLQFRTGEWTRRMLIDHKGYQCSKCKITSWHNADIVLEVNHIDGDCENNIMGNVEFLCPNCHSQTSTFRARNAGNGKRNRKKKGLPL